MSPMFFTAQPITAAEAYRLGVLNHLVPRDQLEAFTYKIAEQICGNSSLAIRVIKQQLRLLSKGHALDAEAFEHIQTLRRLVDGGSGAAEVAIATGGGMVRPVRSTKAANSSTAPT